MAPLQILTLNTWGLWLISKKRYNRILHLAEFLANDAQQKHKLDVVLLQEVWVDTDVRILASAAEQGGLSHCMHFRSGVFGSGLLTLSSQLDRTLSGSVAQIPFTAGDPASINCGDYLAAKGVGWTRLATPSGPLDVFNTHLHANYSHKYGSSTGAQYGNRGAASPGAPNHDCIPPPAVDEFAAFRMAQVLELARFVRHVTSSLASPSGGSSRPLGVVLGGDLNCEPHTLEAHVLRALLPRLQDAWLETHGSLGDPSEADAAGHTCNANCSSFKPRRQRPSRIDYVFTTLRVVACELALQKTPEGHSFSDHIAVQVRLELPSATAAAAAAVAAAAAPAEPLSPEHQQQAGAAARRVALLRAALGVLEEGAQRAAQASAGHVLFAVIMAVQVRRYRGRDGG
ncbi:hypothetical protein VOLCADRAFT_106613 [Volvox carteri f. nagariensis]|uniref:Endonuclease/exonuclease/phosphatase domain-containing protein n=1 Tax=Volvox carteri f. nagariensis TaxID=3068 RepID=D8U8M1_VOLCA|nr:uncharacterized protein VOLCADRAFT_106613 [Volvox carteri f. nagariensis]EFJ43945.1 hypothetical protein VOLCADRAFT_106613 [Volvox carteri f. nagariensis]|eukprot:XP_002954957.1 hypothetical protein VOLCADRAFT_106613 [Volvox carteri f. nagariensis]